MTKRWVYGTRTKEWELVGHKDRDWDDGISQAEMKKIGKKKAKEKYLKPTYIKYKKGDTVQMKDTASSEYRRQEGIVDKDSADESYKDFVSVSLVSDNGRRSVWAVRRNEIVRRKK